MRALGDQIARTATPSGFGATASAGVDPATGALVGAVSLKDFARASTDPAAAVIPRP